MIETTNGQEPKTLDQLRSDRDAATQERVAFRQTDTDERRAAWSRNSERGSNGGNAPKEYQFDELAYNKYEAQHRPDIQERFEALKAAHIKAIVDAFTVSPLAYEEAKRNALQDEITNDEVQLVLLAQAAYMERQAQLGQVRAETSSAVNLDLNRDSNKA